MPLFFGLRMPCAAMAVIAALTGCVAPLTAKYGRTDVAAAAAVLIAFAAYLTAGVGVLNRWDIRGRLLRRGDDCLGGG